jgi:hypothetical protein
MTRLTLRLRIGAVVLAIMGSSTALATAHAQERIIRMKQSVLTVPLEPVEVQATHTLVTYGSDKQQATQALNAALKANSFLVYTKDQVDSITRAITVRLLDSLKRDPDFRANIAAAMLREQNAKPKPPQ